MIIVSASPSLKINLTIGIKFNFKRFKQLDRFAETKAMSQKKLKVARQATKQLNDAVTLI